MSNSCELLEARIFQKALCLALEPELLHGALEAPQGATLIAVQ
jgi:hypothetical protein